MLMAHRTGDPRLIARRGRNVVIADALFTATAVVAQPITGVMLAREIDWSLGQGWIVLSLIALRGDRSVLAAGGVDPDPAA